MDDKLQRILKRYQASLNGSLKIRKYFERLTPDSPNYHDVFRRLMDAETKCQDLDEQIYWKAKTMYIDSEYINHLKQQNNPKTTKQ